MKNKKNLSQTAAAIRQRKRRAAESLDERKTCLTNDRKNKRIKRSLETSNQREAHLNRNRAQNSAESSTSFRDFTVHRDKVRKALCWLKRNNRYYANIIIDDNVLCTLPDEGSIDYLLSQVRDAENRLHHVDYKLHDADRLDSETDDALAHMQSESGSVMWPNIDDTAINEFNMPGYIARAFPTLYPTGWKVCSSSPMVILCLKFSHALAYLTGRKIYVKQSLNGSQLMVGDIQEMMKDDNHMADRVMHFGEGLRGTRQFWQKCSSELYDMIKQLGQKG
ncbi:uncharacterized protein LOC105316640 [Rhizophagus irregularis DAOM 181602=DAOM 197198]|uniref:DUF6570 domain-containing protein n=1 Tax=Rhizophagus irregularis (strain DAOM 181602 / DAOM 197198 / MUCL 43194) TaxID=747089 RepID=U9STG9_RHIID|nr:uncharacterized protein LOC105316640 [Rhizophagus irregularis DAOM 181602=DAOM 197198]